MKTTKTKSLRHRTSYQGQIVNVHYHYEAGGAIVIEDARDNGYKFVSLNINAQKRVRDEIREAGR